MIMYDSDLSSPNHVSLIMDGNRRWKKKTNTKYSCLFKKSVESLIVAIESCIKYRIPTLSVFAFSTENWSRKKDEVGLMMRFIEVKYKSFLEKALELNIKVTFIGSLSRLSSKCNKAFKAISNNTQNCTTLNLVIAFDYGGKWDILNAVKKICKDLVFTGKIRKEEEITEILFSKYLSTSGMTDPDLLIRTGDESRLSNFMLYQLSYTEFFFSEKLWPEFSKEDFDKAIYSYKNRNRRFGK